LSRVLISGVGASDPIRDSYDGPMLHIIRNYRPCKVYLFFTQEMGKRDKIDNRYEVAIKDIDENIEVIKYYTKIENVHLFDECLDDVKNIFSKVINENQDDEILVNITSGTQQFTSTLNLYIVTNSRVIKPIQVTTPAGKSNKSEVVKEDYDVILEIECNEDNLDESANRTIEPNLFVFRNSFIANQIKTLIYKYEYDSALGIIKLNKFYLDEDILKLIRHLSYRYNLKKDLAQKEIIEFEEYDLFPIKDARCLRIVDYFNVMKIKQKKGHLSDFVLMLNPFTINIVEAFIELKLKIRLDKFTTRINKKDAESSRKFAPEKMKRFDRGLYDHISNQNNTLIREEYISISVYLFIIEYYSNNSKDTDMIKNFYSFIKIIDKINRKLRNKVAHNLIAIDEKDFKNDDGTGHTSNQIVAGCEKYISQIFGNVCKKEAFDLYEKLNKFIISGME